MWKITKIITIQKECMVSDLREIIAQELNLNDFWILDLGRIMSDDELLSELDRNVFTIQRSKKL